MSSQRPNLLWICTDQQRWDTIAALGFPHMRTPTLDRMVSEGVAFDHAFAQSPICTASRAAFLTGCYPSRVRNCGNGNVAWSGAAPLVTRLLQTSGYTGGLAGKLHLAGAHGRIEPRPADDGYAEFHWSHDSFDQWPEGHAYADWLRTRGTTLAELTRSREDIPPELHQTPWCGYRCSSIGPVAFGKVFAPRGWWS